MGERRTITASERNILHRAESGAMKFKMRIPLPGLGPALTFTSKLNPFMELYKIIIGRQTKVINMTISDQDICIYQLHNIDFQVFQDFWLTWYNKRIRMGIGDEVKPFLEYAMSTIHEVGYIQFNTASRNWAPVEWVIETPPLLLKPLGGRKFEYDLRWIPMEDGKLPTDAMIGGFEDEPIYIARAHHNNSLCPGKYVPSKQMAFVPWGHREHAKTEFEILCGYNAKWLKTQSNYVPTNAYIAGRSEVQNEPLYIGRCMHDGKLITGKVHVRYKTCYLPYNGKEVEKTLYEILVIPGKEIKQAISLDVLRQSTIDVP